MEVLFSSHDFMDLVISIFILVFNSIQIAAIVNIKGKLTNAQMFILNLAASDLLLGSAFFVVGFTQILIQKFPEHYSTLIAVLIMVQLLYYLSLAVSVTTLIAITLDRLFCVTHPIRYIQRNRKYAVLTCVSIWIGCLVFTIFINVVLYVVSPELSLTVGLVTYPIATISTIALMMLCYGYIWYTVRKQNKLMLTYHTQKASTTIITAEAKRISSELKLRKLSIAILCSFTVFYLPQSISSLLGAVNVIPFSTIPFLIELSNCNSIVNTLLYFGYDWKRILRRFRRASCWGRN